MDEYLITIKLPNDNDKTETMQIRAESLIDADWRASQMLNDGEEILWVERIIKPQQK
ncbi:hypothetical protein [Desulfofustis glycolicus]|uniref:hypothetical protein n=1 Tax=Desulfofustis glycolicus TaxID=51195 RepID=UPI0012948757|nr:hypothetical protein [Desulfofustis glycolicus]